MKAIRPTLFAAAVLLAATPVAFGQILPPAADLSGGWTLQATFTLAPPPPPPAVRSGLDAEVMGPMCGYEGTANLIQNAKGGVTGTASLGLVSGDAPCPAEMSGALTGTLAGNSLTGKLTDPNLGEADFNGTLNPPPMVRAQGAIAEEAHAGLMVAGTNTVLNQAGPFAGAMGTFSAMAAPSVIEVPTLGLAGLAALILLLAASAAYLLARWRTA